MSQAPKVEPLPGFDRRILALGPGLSLEQFDTIMVSLALVDGKPRLALLAADDYGKPRQILAEVGINKAIFDYLQSGINAIDRESLD